MSDFLETERKTGRVFVLAKGLGIAPLEALWPLLAFLFCKDLGATPFQLTLLVAMKPLSALLAFYGCIVLLGRRERLKPYLITVTLSGLFPCFFFPFVDSLWFFILGQACFMFSSRALILAWGEILKLNLSPEARGRAFSRGSTLQSIIHIVIPLLVSPWFDWYPNAWKWVFFGLAFLQAAQLIFLRGIPIPEEERLNSPPKPSIWLPWKEGMALLKRRKDFRHFQGVFFLGGAGLMMMHPVLPFFFKETLQLTCTEVSFATSLMKGIFFAFSSRYWAKLFSTLPIEKFNALVTAMAAGYALLLIFSPYVPSGLLIAYALYGTMQAGSEMSWNLSGPHFAKKEESTLFSSVNVGFVGIRGMIAPFVGELLYLTGSESFVFAFGGLLCLSAAIYSHVKAPVAEKKLTFE